MRAIDSKGKITIMGVTFDGVDDIIRHAVGGKPKGGVYVGEDSQGYPCFDSDDYATENRCYWNFVFAASEQEMRQRLAELKEMPQLRANYDKLTSRLHPTGCWHLQGGPALGARQRKNSKGAGSLPLLQAEAPVPLP